MLHYSVQPRDRIFPKDHGFWSFTKNMDKKIGQNISQNLSSKYSQKPIDYAKQSSTDAFKTASKKAIQKSVEAIGDLISNKTADKITKVRRTSPKNTSGTVTNEHDKEISKERYINLQKKDRK